MGEQSSFLPTGTYLGRGNAGQRRCGMATGDSKASSTPLRFSGTGTEQARSRRDQGHAQLVRIVGGLRRGGGFRRSNGSGSRHRFRRSHGRGPRQHSRFRNDQRWFGRHERLADADSRRRGNARRGNGGQHRLYQLSRRRRARRVSGRRARRGSRRRRGGLGRHGDRRSRGGWLGGGGRGRRFVAKTAQRIRGGQDRQRTANHLHDGRDALARLSQRRGRRVARAIIALGAARLGRGGSDSTRLWLDARRQAVVASTACALPSGSALATRALVAGTLGHSNQSFSASAPPMISISSVVIAA
jgi:hypothetical protein